MFGQHHLRGELADPRFAHSSCGDSILLGLKLERLEEIRDHGLRGPNDAIVQREKCEVLIESHLVLGNSPGSCGILES